MKKRNDRIGEKNINSQGCMMTIIDYRKYEDIDVQFEDGSVSKNKSYGAFKKGEIKNYNIKSITKKPMKNRIGEENLNSQNKNYYISLLKEMGQLKEHIIMFLKMEMSYIH